jgi:hypothetical protein
VRLKKERGGRKKGGRGLYNSVVAMVRASDNSCIAIVGGEE